MKAYANRKHTKLDNIAFILFILLLSYLVNVTAQKQWRNFVWVDNFILFLGFGCRLSASAGNLLKFFSRYCKNWPMRVICHVSKWTEITVMLITLKGQGVTTMVLPKLFNEYQWNKFGEIFASWIFKHSLSWFIFSLTTLSLHSFFLPLYSWKC